jgi:hypothetical protein
MYIIPFPHSLPFSPSLFLEAYSSQLLVRIQYKECEERGERKRTWWKR